MSFNNETATVSTESTAMDVTRNEEDVAMRRMLMTIALGVGLVLAGPVNPLMNTQDAAWAQAKVIKQFKAPFVSLPLRGFFYPPANETHNFAMVTVEEDGQGRRNTTLRYTMRGLTPNVIHTLWFVNLFMITRQGPFPGAAPPSPQGNPYLPWTSGTQGAGYDANGDGILTCGEGVPGFEPVTTTVLPVYSGAVDIDAQSGQATGTGQAGAAFDQNSFCTNEWGHANPVIRIPYDITTKNIPAQNPPLLQTEVIDLVERTNVDGFQYWSLLRKNEALTDRVVPVPGPGVARPEGTVGTATLVTDGVAGGTVRIKKEKRRHILDIMYHRTFDISGGFVDFSNTDFPAVASIPTNPRYGFQKLDHLGRPILRTFRLIPMVVCTHFDGGVGQTHGHHPGDGPDDGPSPTVIGTDHECLMAAMQTTQARETDAD